MYNICKTNQNLLRGIEKWEAGDLADVRVFKNDRSGNRSEKVPKRKVKMEINDVEGVCTICGLEESSSILHLFIDLLITIILK